ncbi:MAG TPA: LysE family transporter [Chitinophagaceae bacterium]|jgi:threonine/homoserine/homoserine lactone efflux protein
MTEALLKGFALGFILALSVGPVIFTIIKQSLNNGPKGGFAFVTGVWLSDILLVVLSNAFTALVTALMTHQRVIGGIGGIFLVGLGIYYVFFKKINLAADSKTSVQQFNTGDFFKLFTSGFLINTLNPSVILFWLGYATILAQNHTMQQRVVIFSVCLVFNMIMDVMKILLAGKLRQRLTVHNISIINKISGTILAVFGLALMYSAVFLGGRHLI